MTGYVILCSYYVYPPKMSAKSFTCPITIFHCTEPVHQFLFEDALLGVNQLSPAPSSIVVRGESPHSTPKLGVPEYAP